MSDEPEEWRPVTEPDFSDLYMVSSKGRVAKILLASPSRTNGYRTVLMSKKGRAYRSYRLHQLVAWAFRGPQPEGTVINHEDTDKSNNTPGNLEYVTQKENVRHGIRMGCRTMRKKPANGQFAPILSVDQVGEIKSLLNCGCPVYLIAKDYQVSTQSIRHIKSGRNWNRVVAKP